MDCFNCGRKIALYMEGTDDIKGRPHCGLCREYERKIEDLKSLPTLVVEMEKNRTWNAIEIIHAAKELLDKQ